MMKVVSLIALSIILGPLRLNAQKQVTHYNLVFAPDLSNRLNPKLYPKSVSDPDIVEGILNKIWPEILKINRDDEQKDHYSIDFINKGLIGMYKVNPDFLAIDFQRFEKQIDRINYIMGRNKVSRTLSKDINNFTTEYRKFNYKASISNNGADIWTYFQSGIDDRVVLPDITNGKVRQKFRNIMVLLTDGYIEAGIFGKGYDLSSSKISNFRVEFLKSKETSLQTFLSKNPSFKVKHVNNFYLNNLELIVLEMYDRSLSKTGAATKHPTDMEIMKLIWSDWLNSSGIKRFELKPVATRKEDAIKYVMDFIKK